MEKTIAISTIHQSKSIGCSCGYGISYPEKFFSKFLNQLKVNYRFQLGKDMFEWCENHRYDFYFELDNKKYIVEIHGRQHYKESGLRETLGEIQLNDYIKKKKGNR